MTIAEIKFPYGTKADADTVTKLNASLIFGNKFEPDEDGVLPSWHNHLVLLESMPLELEFIVVKIVTHPEFDKLAHAKNPTFNQKVKVVVPGNGLLNIKRVEVKCDMCTDELQRYLQAGWCILAVCPQPDQRRPDYVLGLTLDPSPGV